MKRALRRINMEKKGRGIQKVEIIIGYEKVIEKPMEAGGEDDNTTK